MLFAEGLTVPSTRIGAVRGGSPRPSISDCSVLSQPAVNLVAAPTTQLGGLMLHRYSDVAVDVAVDIYKTLSVE
jgi:hypothetical protein